MVQVIQQDPGIGGRFGQGLAEGAKSGIEALSKQLQEHKEQKKFNEYLDDIPEDTTEDDKLMYMLKAPVNDTLKSKGIDALIKMQKAKQMEWTPEKQTDMESLLQDFGIPKEDAKRNSALYGKLTTGGQTGFANMMLDNIMRNPQGSQTNAPIDAPTNIPNNVTPNVKEITPDTGEFKYPEINEFENLTPKEQVKKQSELRKENTPIYTENRKKVKSLKSDANQFKRMEKISPSMPSGAGRINVNPITGDLIVPALANNDTQEYAKILAGFQKKAKESYAGRVSNFELRTHMKQYPGLLNSEEGREVLLNQLQTLNEIDMLHADAINDVFKHYGQGKISMEKADEIASQMTSQKEDDLWQKYQDYELEGSKISMGNIQEEHPNQTLIKSPNGIPVWMDDDKVDSALQNGGELI